MAKPAECLAELIREVDNQRRSRRQGHWRLVMIIVPVKSVRRFFPDVHRSRYSWDPPDLDTYTRMDVLEGQLTGVHSMLACIAHFTTHFDRVTTDQRHGCLANAGLGERCCEFLSLPAKESNKLSKSKVAKWSSVDSEEVTAMHVGHIVWGSLFQQCFRRWSPHHPCLH